MLEISHWQVGVTQHSKAAELPRISSSLEIHSTNPKQEMGYLVKFQVMLLPGITSAHASIHHVLSSP